MTDPASAPDLIAVRRALVSVSDKDGLADLATALQKRGVEIVSTGGTARAIAEAGVPVTDVSHVTHFPEIMGGRVKTLHPMIHGGLLAVRTDPHHQTAMSDHGIRPFDLVVVNLYPFEETAAGHAGFEEVIEEIDVGGPAMIRAAAKNHAFCAVVVEPADYPKILDALEIHEGALPLDLRRRLAAKAFARTAAYDAAISAWFRGHEPEVAPTWVTIGGRLRQTMRYGENPHQRAAFYATGTRRPGVATAHQVQGKELSYNNINDADAAFELVAEFDPGRMAACAIIKHANPCGVGAGETLVEAYERALACDPVSAFGGIVAVNRSLDVVAARKVAEIFTEVIIAPDAKSDALELLSTKANLRVLLTHGLPDPAGPGETVRSVAGGFLLQGRDDGVVAMSNLKVVTRRAPTEREWADLRFAWRVVKHVKSNAIVYARDLATVGIGAGQMSRVDSARIAALKAADATEAAGAAEPMTTGSVAASDAFFPFPDGLIAIAEAGATAIIQPGGSVRDAEVIAAADERGIAMVFTGIRHFRH